MRLRNKNNHLNWPIRKTARYKELGTEKLDEMNNDESKSAKSVWIKMRDILL